MSSILLGFDVGSSSVKTSLVDGQSGHCIATASFPAQEAPIKAVQTGWAEQDPDSWWTYARQGLAAVMADAHVSGNDIAAIGISYQMHGLVCVDKNLRPLRDSIIWCDSRAVPYGERAFREIGDKQCLDHLLNSPGNFTAAKLAWVKENEPHIFQQIHKIMLPGDYIALRLSGEATTTASGLSEGMLWDFKENQPAWLVMDYYGFPHDILPAIVPTFGQQGEVSAAAAQETGLRQGTPICYRAGDQPNNALSLNVFNPGEIASTAGTSGVVYGVLGEVNYDSKSRVNIFAHVNHMATGTHQATPQTRLGVLGICNGTGILNAWIRRNVATDMSYNDMNKLAATIPIGSEGISILPFGNGAERILENKEPGCSIHGMNFNIHNRAHLIRAAQEGIVFAFCYGMEIMQQMGMDITKIHAGNANMFLSPVFRETLAATSGAVIELYDTDGSVGAARGAGMGCRMYQDNNEAFAALRCIQHIEPDTDNSPYIEAYQRWKNILEKTL